MNNVVVTAPGASTTNLGVSGGTPVLNNVLTDDDGGTKVIFQPSTGMGLNETTPLSDKGNNQPTWETTSDSARSINS